MNENSLAEDIASKKDISFLAVIKHENDIITEDPKSWPGIICGSDYIEAVTINDIATNNIHEVRTSRKNLQPYFKYLQNKLENAEPIENYDDYLLSLIEIMDKIEENEISLEIL